MILLGLSLIVDYYFIHILFQEKQQILLKQNQNEMMPHEPPLPPPPEPLPPVEPGP